jgi:hypothetical protein
MVVGLKNAYTPCLVSLVFVSFIPIHDEDISYEVMSGTFHSSLIVQSYARKN